MGDIKVASFNVANEGNFFAPDESIVLPAGIYMAVISTYGKTIQDIPFTIVKKVRPRHESGG